MKKNNREKRKLSLGWRGMINVKDIHVEKVAGIFSRRKERIEGVVGVSNQGEVVIDAKERNLRM